MNAIRFVTRCTMIALSMGPLAPCLAQQPPPTPACSDTVVMQSTDSARAAEGRRGGEALAARQGDWFGRAYLTGFAWNVIGAAIILPIASGSTPLPPQGEQARITARGEAYATVFEQAYTTNVRRKRVRTSTAGVTLGTLTIFALFVRP